MALEKLKAKINAAQALTAARAETVEPKTPPALAKLEEKHANSKGKAGEYTTHAEITRIIKMPKVLPMTPEEKDEFDREHILAEAYHDGFRLLTAQANGLLEYELYSGILGPIGVGQGKTLLTLMIANAAYQKGLRKMMLMVPPEVLVQLVTDIKAARTKVPITYPIHILGGRPIQQRRALAKSGKKGLYVFPYSLLSTRDTDENLADIMPEIIIGDEAHRISNPSAARTRRMTSFIEENKPDCVFVSGTITSKSVMDYYHLIRAALGRNNPLPNTKSLAHEWAAVIDADQVDWDDEDKSKGGPGPLVPLVQWARANFPEEQIKDSRDGFRRAYRLRLTTCPGVVSSGDSDIGTSLMFANQPIEDHKEAQGWRELDMLVRKIEDQWLTPNDDEIEHAIHTWKWLYELSTGFYNQLVWPEPADFARRRRIPDTDAERILLGAMAHHEAGQFYAKELRTWLQDHAKPKLDTPFLVGQDMARNGSENVGTQLYEAWRAWKALDFEGRPDRDAHAIRVCPFKIDAAIAWAQSLKGQGGIVWYHHQDVGKWLYEKACEAELNAMHCPAGANERILDHAHVKKIVIASISAHGTGKNLQHFEQQCVVQWPRSAKIAEQLLGRLHRTGQKADEIEVRTFNTLEFDEMNFAACLNDALYIHQTTGVRQKMIYGGYNPLPRIFPPAVLRERGAEGVKDLNAEQQKLMQEKFGQ